MAKVDEKAHVGSVDAAARVRLTAALDRPGVIAASLFGSQATGRVGGLSDVDVALWREPLVPEQAHALRIELTDAAAGALGTGEVDLVVLNDASPSLRFHAIRDGVRLLDRDPGARVRLETAAVLEYLDTAPLRLTLAEGSRRRLREGSFGRR